MWLIEGLPALWAAPDSDVHALIGCGKRVCELSGGPPADPQPIGAQSPRARPLRHRSRLSERRARG